MSFPYDSILTSKGKTIVSAAASLTASAFLFRTIANELVPAPLQDYFSSRLRKLSSHLSFQLTILIQDHDGLTPNHMFHAADLYLGTRLSPSTRRIKVNKPDIDDDLIISIDKNQEITDIFQGIKFVWILHSTIINSNSKVVSSNSNSKPRTEQRSFELSCRKKYKEVALKTYLPYILEKAKEIREQNKAVRLHMVDYNGPSYWGSVVLNHPASFDTVAMDPDAKRELIQDLERFINRKDYYRKVGKAWKRGYLFYGPPGTGKSSLVAAMANYLKFDIYDLALEEVQCNSDLRRLLIGTANQSILVIEDIDCSVGLESRNSDEREAESTKITLSGLLNFIDGLWSSCGDERIIVFTTNHKDRLDPALLRPGRMDVHLEMSYCTFSGFKILASNYLDIHEHRLFDEIQQLLVKVQATPAEVAGELMKGDNAEVALHYLLTKLQAKLGHAVALRENSL